MSETSNATGLVLKTVPGSEPFTLTEAKLFLKSDVTDDDALITAIIVAARERAENLTRRQLVTATWVLTLDRFPKMYERWRPGTGFWPLDANQLSRSGEGVIDLPRPKLQSVTHIKYRDADDAQQTLSNTLYQVDIATIPGRVRPIDGEEWPETFNRLAAVEIEFVCGYGVAAAVPESLKNWMKVLMAGMYENRTPVIEGNVSDLAFIDGLLDEHVVVRL